MNELADSTVTLAPDKKHKAHSPKKQLPYWYLQHHCIQNVPNRHNV